MSESKPQSLRELMTGNILVLTVSRVIWSLSNSVVFTYLPLYIIALGGDTPTIGNINALASIVGMMLYPVGGYLADKAGRAKLVGIATFLYASSFILFMFAPTWEWLAVGRAYQTMVLFYMPALNAIMADSIPVGARGKILSLTMVIPEAVRILSPFIGGWLIESYSLIPAMKIGYTLSLFTSLIVAVMRFKYLKETITTGEPIGRDIVGIFRESYSNTFSSIRWIFTELRGYVLIALLLTLVNSIVQPFWVLYAKQEVLLTEYEWGQVLLVAGVAKTVLSLFIGTMVDRLGTRKCMMIGLFVAAPTMILFTMAGGFYHVVAVYFVLVIANAFLWIASNVLLADSIPRSTRGRVMASMGQGIGVGISGGGYARGFLLFIPATIGSMLGGYIYDYNAAYPWLIQSVVLLVCVGFTYMLVKEPEKAQA